MSPNLPIFMLLLQYEKFFLFIVPVLSTLIQYIPLSSLTQKPPSPKLYTPKETTLLKLIHQQFL